MPKYRLYYRTGASTYIDVEAANQDEAIEKAEQEFDPPYLCAQCSGWGRPGVDLGEWEPEDGTDAIVEVSA